MNAGDKFYFVEEYEYRMKNTIRGLAAGLFLPLAVAPASALDIVLTNDDGFETPLADVTGVRVKGGILTKIIDIETQHGKLSIRCFGAKDFAAAIEQQAKKTSAG